MIRVVLGLGLLGGLLLALRGDEDRSVLAAVEAESAASLAGFPPSSSADLWERLKVMGVNAAILREETLSDLSARGEVLHFSRAEVEKWRAAGLAAPGSGPRGDSLWVRDPKTVERVAEALAARGLDVSTASVSGARTFGLPAGFDPGPVPAGFAPGGVAALSAAGLLPIAVPRSAMVDVAGRRLWVKSLPVGAGREEILRAAYGRPMRLILFRFRPTLGLDDNLDLLRSSLRVLREAGFSSALPAPRPARGLDAGAGRTVRLLLAWLIAAAGPLLAVRAALQSSRLVRGRLPSWGAAASPVPEIFAGLAASWAAASMAGIFVAGVVPAGWRDGSERAWMIWTWCAPLAIGAAALFDSSARGDARWSSPVRRRDLAAAAGLIVAVALLVAPRAALRVSSLWESFDRLSMVAGALWWWPWRWREVLVGAPSLVISLFFIGGAREKKGWLLLGLLAPAGLVAAVGGGGEPVSTALVHGAAAHALGGVLGGLVAGLLVLLDRWSERPKPSLGLLTQER